MRFGLSKWEKSDFQTSFFELGSGTTYLIIVAIDIVIDVDFDSFEELATLCLGHFRSIRVEKVVDHFSHDLELIAKKRLVHAIVLVSVLTSTMSSVIHHDYNRANEARIDGSMRYAIGDMNTALSFLFYVSTSNGVPLFGRDDQKGSKNTPLVVRQYSIDFLRTFTVH